MRKRKRSDVKGTRNNNKSISREEERKEGKEEVGKRGEVRETGMIKKIDLEERMRARVQKGE